MTGGVEAALVAEIEDLRARLRKAEAALTAYRDESGEPGRRGPAKTERILEALAEAPDGLPRAELAEALGMRGREDLLSSALAHLKRTKRVRRSDDGRWSLPQ